MNTSAPRTLRRPDLLPKTWYRLKGVFAEALERDAREREAYVASACGDDAELRARVLALLQAHAIDDHFIERSAAENLGWAEEPADPSWIGRRIGRYRVTGEAGRGGLSYVFRAVRDDGEFAQEVAIKLLRPGVASTAMLVRFHAERRMLATLAHPNVAHFLDGGTTEDGAPYLVMEFVEGEPIDQWADARALGLEARLELVRTLCGAVHYVHQNLVVHGDLKGGNVLVTRDGVVKLLDFGIARLLGPDGDTAAPRPATLLLMTPEYASPEQLRGEKITTASDVYSLGALLYRLLTGATPFGGGITTPVAIAERMAAGEPTLPSAMAAKSPGVHARFARALRGDLDTILLKALKRVPGERYGSAQQLAEDLQRYLGGFPIEARPDSPGYRLAKFARRHAAASVAAGLALVSLVGGTAVAVWQAREADAERARAERHFHAVRQLSAAYLGDVYDAVLQIPGSTAARKLLVDKSLEYLAALERDAAGSIEVQRDLGKAWERAGDVQGAYIESNLGQPEQALESYRRALAIRERVFAAQPTLQHRLELLASHVVLGEVLLSRDGFDEARGVVADAVRHADAAIAAGAAGADLRPVHAAYLNQGWLMRAQGDLEAAAASLERARRLAETMAAAQPQDRTARRTVGLVLGRLGELHMAGTGNLEEALRYYRQTYAIFDTLAREVPDNPDLARGRAFARATIGQLLVRLQRPQEALRELEPEVVTLDRARRADPADAVAPIALGAVLVLVGESRLQLGEYDAAARRYDEAARWLPPELAAAGAELRVVYAQLLAGRARAQLGRSATLTGDARAALVAEARRNAGRAVELLEPLTRSGNEVLEARRQLQLARAVLAPG